MIPPSPSVRDEIRRLERLRQEEPGGLVFARLAEAYRSAGRYELAMELLEEGIRDGPEHPAGHLVMARVHHDLREPRREREALERALAIDPGNAVARRALDALPVEGEGDEPGDGDEPGAVPEGRRASHSPEERRELLEQLDRVSRDDWWETEPGGSPAAASAEEGEEDGVVTETMAHLYARQGLWDRAESLYRRLAGTRPEDHRLSRALEMVRREEIPERPPRRVPDPPAPSAPAAAGDGGGGEEGGPGAPAGTTIRAHLQELLRGRTRGDDGSRAGPDGPRRMAGEADDGEEPEADPAMEELLQRWRRAARKGDGG